MSEEGSEECQHRDTSVTPLTKFEKCFHAKTQRKRKKKNFKSPLCVFCLRLGVRDLFMRTSEVA
jgi:hypothetical protein